MTTNPLEGWQDIVIPPPKNSREWLQRQCGIKADISKWKFTSEEVVQCLSRYTTEQNAGLEKKLNTATQVFSSSAESLNGTIVMELIEFFKLDAGKCYDVVARVKILNAENLRMKNEIDRRDAVNAEIASLMFDDALKVEAFRHPDCGWMQDIYNDVKSPAQEEAPCTEEPK